MKTLAVALLNYNGRQHLETFLPSVVEHSQPHRVILIDNGSTDDSIAYLEEHFPSVELIRFNENHGFCGGYNRALKIIDTDYVVLLNTDVEVTANWITPVLDLLESDEKLKAAQPKILDFKNKTHFEYAGASGGYIDRLGYPFCRGRLFESLEEDTSQYDQNREIFWASGSSLFVERNTFNQLGGLDEHFFAHMEEIDLCWRIWNAGFKVAACPESTVYHLGGGTLNKQNPKKTYLNFRNGLSMLLKNETTAALFWKIPLRIMLDWVAAVKISLDSGFSHGLAIAKAHWHFLLRSINYIKGRKQTQRHKKSPRFQGLIVFQYFIKGRKTFEQLPNKFS